MKVLNILFLALATFGTQSALAGFTHLNCNTYRVSKDSNQNIQPFSIDQNLGVNINGVLLTEAEWIDGSLNDIYPDSPVNATYKSKDGKGDYKIQVTVVSQIASLNGHANVGRDHDVNIYNVLAKVSRNGKTHEFAGTCINENMTSCGGACAEESNDRDEL